MTTTTTISTPDAPPAASAAPADAPFVLAGRTFTSRLIVGTGKYATFPLMKQALEESAAEIVTVAVRRVNLTDRAKESLLDFLPAGMTILPNTAGCFNADDAVRAARLGREVGLSEWVKLEVLGDEQTLWPDNEELLAATKTLVKEGFVVFPYTSDDPIMARKLEDAGAAAVMPLGAPIGSGLGIQNPNNLSIILERARVPVIVDAGVGTASDACVAMELGAEAVLMNTGIAGAREPVRMARAMRDAVRAGRDAFLAGRIPRKRYATASSPLAGIIGS
jgi:thiazole synthase